jgi:hypothetical protein
MSDLVKRLRNASQGHKEWRVQDPKDGSYCMAYTWPDSFAPEREARQWLEDHKTRHPDSMFVDYEVKEVVCKTAGDEIIESAADRIEALEAALRHAREALKWYVAEDDVLEGEQWEEENAFWIAGKRDAESSIAAINDLLKD